MQGFGEDIHKNEARWPAKSKAGRALGCPMAPPRRHPPASLPPTARVLACWPQRAGQAGEDSSGIAARVALWAALASAGDHLLAVNASPARLGRRRGNGGGGLRSVCVSIQATAAGTGRELLGRREPRDRSARQRGPATTMAGSATHRCSSVFAKAWELPSLQEEAGVPRRSREQKALRTHPEEEKRNPRVYLELNGPRPRRDPRNLLQGICLAQLRPWDHGTVQF